MFLEISQNSQENTCARVSFLIKLQAAPANNNAKLEMIILELFSLFQIQCNYVLPKNVRVFFIFFITSLPLNVTLISKNSYLTAHYKINYETVTPKVFRKSIETYIGFLQQIHLCLFGFNPLTNFIKNIISVAMEVLDQSLKYYTCH